MNVNFSDNYFELFDLPVSMGIDTDKLDTRYKALQHELHPDRFAGASDSEKRWSMQATSLVNQARQTLTDPLSRASYLLSLSGINLDNETDTRMSGEFLMTQMELREALEEAKSSENPLASLDDLTVRVRRMSRNTEADFTRCHEEDNLPAAREIAREWQFLAKLQTEIDELESSLDNY